MKQKRLFWFILFSFVYAWFGRDGLNAQSPTPDCKITFSLTATGRSPSLGFPNGSASEPGCVTWTIVYYNTGFSALSLRLESAPDSSGAAGTWGAFSGTTVTGSNPNTTTTQNYTVVTGYNPWVSVNLTSVTGSGSIKGTAYGWKVPGFVYNASTITPSGTQDVNLVKVGGAAVALGQAAMAASIPVVIASNQSAIPVTTTPSGSGTQTVQGVAASGAADSGNPVKVGGSNGTNDYNLKVDSQGNNYSFLGCNASAEVALSGTGYVEIVAGSASQVIKICKVLVTSVSGGNPTVNTFSVASATITSCASPTELALYGAVTGVADDWGGALASASGKSICVSESVANTDKVTITYQKATF